MDKRDIMLAALAVGLIYTGLTVHSLQKHHSELSSEVDSIGDQVELSGIYRSYNPAENVSITADTVKDFSTSNTGIEADVSISVDSGMFDLEQVEVTAYDGMKNEVWSEHETADIRVDANNTADFVFDIPVKIPEDDELSSVRLIKIQAVDETAYIDEDGEFGYGTEYKGRDVGVDNPSQLYAVVERCIDEIEDLSDLCYHSLEPLNIEFQRIHSIQPNGGENQ